MRKLFLCLAVAATCLIPSPPPTMAAFPCGTYCCNGTSGSTTRCGYNGGWTTCGAYWTLTHSVCP
jgi:hypothetical protein